MYCQKCGNEVNENDTFCSYCGTKVNETIDNASNYYTSEINSEEKINTKEINNSYKNMFDKEEIKKAIKGNMIFNKISIYLKNPISIFNNIKDKDTNKYSIICLFIMPIIYGIFHMLYFISFFKSISNKLGNYMDSLKNNLLGNILSLGLNSNDLSSINDSISQIRGYISSNINYSEYFLNGIFIMILTMLATFIIIELSNSLILKNNISQKNILLLITIGFIPLLISLIVNNIVVYISIIATIFIFFIGIIMSLITIFGGLIQLTDGNYNKAYYAILIISIILAITMPLLISKNINSIVSTIVNGFSQIIQS